MLGLDTQPAEHRESTSGRQSVDLIIDNVLSGNIKMRLEDFSKENLALASFGTASIITAGTATSEPIVAKLGYSVPLKNINLTEFTSLKIQNGIIQTIAATGNYSVNLNSGMITFEATPASSALVNNATCLCTYTYGSHKKITGFTETRKHYYLRFNGLNTVDSDQPVIIEVFKVTFNPMTELSLINTELSTMDIEGDMLYSNTGIDGNYFRVRYIG
jgi:hypothetical protein